MSLGFNPCFRFELYVQAKHFGDTEQRSDRDVVIYPQINHPIKIPRPT